MKPTVEKPSENVMKFFTPELYIRFNSEDEAVSDQADEEWDHAVEEYEKHLEKLGGFVTRIADRLEAVGMHDAEFLNNSRNLIDMETHIRMRHEFFPFWMNVLIMSFKQEGKIISLNYIHWDEARVYPALDTWRFSKKRSHWLYDEIDASPRGQSESFVHRILLSDGCIFEIPFGDLLIHEIRLAPLKESLPEYPAD